MKYFIWMGIGAITALLNACGGHAAHTHEEHAHEQEHSHEVHVHGEHAHEASAQEIVLAPEKAEAAGVKVEEVKYGSFSQVIPVSGQILSAQGEESTVVASVSGVVSFSSPLTEGMPVTSQKVLLTISSDNLQDGDWVQRARIAYETARKEYERAEKLVGRQIVSQKEFNALKENYEKARLAFEALSPGKNGKGVAVRSSIGGYLKSCLVKEGDYVSVGQPLLSVTRNRRLQLRAEVSERFYPALASIRSAHFRTAYSNQVFRLEDLNGRLLSYGKSAGQASFYIPVVFELDNRGNLLPGAFAEVYLLGEPRQHVISLPVTALTEEQGVYFVYQQLDAACYRKVEVKVGASDGCRVEILSGLKEGELVVTEGAIHVKLASASNAIPAHTHNH